MTKATAPEFDFDRDAVVERAITALRDLPIDDFVKIAVIFSANLSREHGRDQTSCLGALAATVEDIHVALNAEG